MKQEQWVTKETALDRALCGRSLVRLEAAPRAPTHRRRRQSRCPPGGVKVGGFARVALGHRDRAGCPPGSEPRPTTACRSPLFHAWVGPGAGWAGTPLASSRLGGRSAALERYPPTVTSSESITGAAALPDGDPSGPLSERWTLEELTEYVREYFPRGGWTYLPHDRNVMRSEDGTHSD